MRNWLLFVLMFLPLCSHAQISWEEVDRLAAAVQPQVVEWRRWFHENPELSNREFNTSRGREAGTKSSAK